MAMIHELMPKVMEDVGVIAKSSQNTQQKYNFRGVDAALSKVNPVLIRHGISVTVEVIRHRVTISEQQRQGKDPQKQYHATLRMKVTFYAADGSSLVNTLAGEGLDYGGDKATNKAMSAAFKYGLFFGLVIPVHKSEIEDSDRDERRKPKQQVRNSKAQDEYATLVHSIESAIDRATKPEVLKRYRGEIPNRHLATEDESRLLDAIEEKLHSMNGVSV